jgi:hypothetical protein
MNKTHREPAAVEEEEEEEEGAWGRRWLDLHAFTEVPFQSCSITNHRLLLLLPVVTVVFAYAVCGPWTVVSVVLHVGCSCATTRGRRGWRCGAVSWWGVRKWACHLSSSTPRAPPTTARMW